MIRRGGPSFSSDTARVLRFPALHVNIQFKGKSICFAYFQREIVLIFFPSIQSPPSPAAVVCVAVWGLEQIPVASDLLRAGPALHAFLTVTPAPWGGGESSVPKWCFSASWCRQPASSVPHPGIKHYKMLILVLLFPSSRLSFLAHSF